MVHPWGFANSRWGPNGAPLGFFVNSRWDPNNAPLGFCELAVGPQWCTRGVLCIGGGIPMLNPWGL